MASERSGHRGTVPSFDCDILTSTPSKCFSGLDQPYGRYTETGKNGAKSRPQRCPEEVFRRIRLTYTFKLENCFLVSLKFGNDNVRMKICFRYKIVNTLKRLDLRRFAYICFIEGVRNSVLNICFEYPR